MDEFDSLNCELVEIYDPDEYPEFNDDGLTESSSLDKSASGNNKKTKMKYTFEEL